MSTPILVIDANREFGILIRQSLEESGDYRVTLAANSAEAIERTKAEEFELALIDLNLADSSPAELIPQLRSIRSNLPIVIIPRPQSEGTHLASLGVQGVLTKPFYLPNLPGILQQILEGRTGRAWGTRSSEPPNLQPAPARTDDREAKAAPVRQDPSAPLTNDELLERLEMTDTAAAILVGSRGLLAAAGLGPTGASEAASILLGRGPDNEPGAAVAHYVRLSGAVQDYLLYGIRLESGYILGAFFPSEAAFGVVRRNTHELAQLLADLPAIEMPQMPSAPDLQGPQIPPQSPEIEDEPLLAGLSDMPPIETVEVEATPERPAAVLEPEPETTPLGDSFNEIAESNIAEESAAIVPEQPVPEPAGDAHTDSEGIESSKLPTMGGAKLPSDWIPVSSPSQGQWALLEDMISAPAAEATATTAEERPPQMQDVTLPRDWVPTQQPPEAYLPSDLLATTEELCPSKRAEQTEIETEVSDEPAGSLSYTMVLVPRFPEHHLTGAFASLLRRWTDRFGLAWDWHVHTLEIENSYLLLHLSLPGDIAPAAALSRLQAHLSDRILNHFPTLGRELPSGRFWAPQEWLFSGSPPSRARLRALVMETRRAQGVVS
ncbi:MAG: response regulator [Anaerolineales bacterium]